MVLRLKLDLRRPRWWEKKWKPKKPVLYILEYVNGKWVNTYWWGGNWRGSFVMFYGPAEAKIRAAFFGIKPESNHVYLVVGRSGTFLTVDGVDKKKIKSLHMKDTEWTYFGDISGLGIFLSDPKEFDLMKEIEKS